MDTSEIALVSMAVMTGCAFLVSLSAFIIDGYCNCRRAEAAETAEVVQTIIAWK